MNWLNPLFLSSGLSGLSLIVVALISSKYPPKQINSLYGYRTSRSMASQHAWDFSQTTSTNLMLWIGVYNCLIAIPGLFMSMDVLVAVGISLTFLIGTCIYLFRSTERELKRRFGE